MLPVQSLHCDNIDSSTPFNSRTSRTLLRHPSAYVGPLTKHDDESERNRRRNNADNQSRSSYNSIVAKRTDGPILSNAIHLNQKQLFDALTKCQRMFTANKITKHNVWDVHVVEYMRRYLGMQSDAGSMDILKFASSALDVSSKVYGLRVDCVYDTSMKLASRINRICAQGDVYTASDVEGNESDTGKDEPTLRKQQKAKEKQLKRRIAKATIARDDSELFGSLPLIESSMFNAETNIMNSKTENYLSSRLLFSKSGTTMNIWNEDSAFRRVSDVDDLVSEQRVLKSFPIQLLSKTLPPICPQLRNFVLDEWDPQQDVPYQYIEEVVYDKHGFPVPEIDMILNNDNFDGDPIYINSDDEDMDYQILPDELARNRLTAFVVDFNPDDSNMLQVNEYSYLNNTRNVNNQLSQIWAGPSHWKLKALNRRVARYTGVQKDQDKCKPAKRTKKEVENISFEHDIPDILLTNKQLKSNQTIPSADKSTLFMPLLTADLLMLDRKLAKFESVTNIIKKKNTQSSFKIEHNFENPNIFDKADDGVDDCENNTLNTSQMSVTDEEGIDNMMGSDANFLAYNLVEKPDMILQPPISYKTRAKKINMKELKKAIWECLTDTNKNAEAPPRMAGTVRFRDLLTILPTKLSTQARVDLTCQIVFVALLHLANEHSLVLNNSEDIVIRQEIVHNINKNRHYTD